jgi:hypothetical protein
MRVLTVLTLFLLCLVLALAACNQGSKQKPSGAAGEKIGAGQQSGSEAAQAARTAAEKAPEHPRIPANPQLAGTWFALFGRHDNGVEESTWENGHRVRFIQDGNNLWVRVENGWNVAALNAKYEVMGDTVQIKFSPRSAVEYGLSKIAPLGLGRDEEVGLSAKTPSRDAEIGLAGKAAGEKAGDAERVESLKFQLVGDLLVLTDSKTNVMVYARVADEAATGVPDAAGTPAPPSAPDESGEWTGNLGSQTGVTASAKSDAGKLTLSIGGGNGQFSGQFVQGYFVGKLNQDSRLSLAVLYPAPDGTLKGLLLPDPYAKAEIPFDFKRSTASAPAGSPVQ